MLSLRSIWRVADLHWGRWCSDAREILRDEQPFRMTPVPGLPAPQAFSVRLAEDRLVVQVCPYFISAGEIQVGQDCAFGREEVFSAACY